MAVVRGAIGIAIHFASVGKTVAITIRIAFVWDAIAIAVVATDFTSVRDAVAIAILKRLTHIWDAVGITVGKILAVIRGAVRVAIHFASIGKVVAITIGLAIIRDTVGIAVVAVEFTFVGNRVAVAIIEGFALIGFAVAIAVGQIFAVIREAVPIAIINGAGVHIACATLNPGPTNAATEPIGDIIETQCAFIIWTRQAASATRGARFLRAEGSCS